MHELGSCNEGVDYVREKEILHRTSCTEAPQQNGIAGSKQKDFREVKCALMLPVNTPSRYWGVCILTAGCYINRFLSPLLHLKSPFEFLYETEPPNHHLWSFGHLCFAFTSKKGRDMFQLRAQPCVFMGSPFGKKKGINS